MKKAGGWLRLALELGGLFLAVATGFMAYSELDARAAFALEIQTREDRNLQSPSAPSAGAELDTPPGEPRDKSAAMAMLDDLAMRGVSPGNHGVEGIRSALGWTHSAEKQGTSWSMESPADGARWAFSRTRNTLLLLYVTALFSVLGSALPQLRRESEPLLRARPVAEGAILAVVLLLLALSAPRLLYATETGSGLWLRASVAPLLGFFAGAFRRSATVIVRGGVNQLAQQIVKHGPGADE
jgi:hypothetical protein